jgi:hypothetical protein
MAVQNIELIHACGHSKMRAKPRTEGMHALVLSSAARTLCSRCIDEHETRRTRMIADSISRAREAARLTKLKGSPKQLLADPIARSNRSRNRRERAGGPEPSGSA